MKQITKISLSSIFVIPLLAAGMALFMDFGTTTATKDKAIISLEIEGNNELNIKFSYTNLIKYLSGENVPLTAAQKFQNLAHITSSTEPQTKNNQNYLQNAYQLLVKNSDLPNIYKPILDNNELSTNSGFLNNLKNSALQGVASFDIFAVPIDAVNPPPDGEQLASFALAPDNYFKNPSQKFFQESKPNMGVAVPTDSSQSFTTDQLNDVYSQFKDTVIHKTIAGGHKYSLEFQLNAVNNKSNEAPFTDADKGWISTTVGSNYFKPYFGDGIWAPDLNVGDVFRFPIYIDSKFQHQDVVNNSNIVKFNIGANFGVSTMSVVNIIWIAGAIIITLLLFSPLVVYAIRKW